MINIRPVSDLRNKYPEIEKLVLNEGEAVYLTKNGHGSMVVMSLEKYEELTSDLELNKELERKFGNVDIEKMLLEAENEVKNLETKYYSHEEIFSEMRRIIKGEE